MAGYTTIYCIGSGGGFAGADGMNPILAQLWMGEGERIWFVARYFESGFGPMGKLATIIPPAPNREDNLLDACLAFFPRAFEACDSYATVVDQLGDRERLDFHLHPEDVPAAWDRLREEAREDFRELGLWEAELEPYRRGG